MEYTGWGFRPGDGVYPETDPWGGEFKDRRRASLAGQRIAGQYVSVLEEIQGDQDFIRILFNPSRSMETFINISFWLIQTPIPSQIKSEKMF